MAGEETVAQGGMGCEVDAGPRHRQRTVDQRLIRIRRDAIGGKLRLVINPQQNEGDCTQR